MKIFRYGLIFISSFFLLVPIYKGSVHFSTVGWEKISNFGSVNILNRNNDNLWEIINKTGDKDSTKILDLPYIEYDTKGLIANYNIDSSNIEIFDILSNKHYTINNTSRLLPFLANPFIVMMSEDRTYIEVYKIYNDTTRFLGQISTENIITAVSSSPNGRYLVVSTLSNKLLVIDSLLQSKDDSILEQKNISLKSKNSPIYGAGITDNGLFFGLCGDTPTNLFFGQLKNISTVSLSSIPSPIQTTSQIFIQHKNIVAYHSIYNNSFLEISPNQISYREIPLTRPYSLIDFTYTKNYMNILYKVSKNDYVLDILSNKYNRFVQKIHISTSSIPQFITTAKNQVYLVYKEGGIIL